MNNPFTLTISADINEIPRVSTALEDVMRVHAFSEEEILDAQLAVEEAVTNVIVHGFAGKPGSVGITFASSPGIVEVEIEDQAPQFDPLSIPEPDVMGDIDERRIGGLGVFLLKQVMDDVSYRYENGKNILSLTKRKSG